MRAWQDDSGYIGTHDAKVHLSELLRRVDKGEAFTITRNGEPIAKLVPVREGVSPATRGQAIDHWLASARGMTLGGLTTRDLIDDGRV